MRLAYRAFGEDDVAPEVAAALAEIVKDVYNEHFRGHSVFDRRRGYPGDMEYARKDRVKRSRGAFVPTFDRDPQRDAPEHTEHMEKTERDRTERVAAIAADMNDRAWICFEGRFGFDVSASVDELFVHVFRRTQRQRLERDVATLDPKRLEFELALSERLVEYHMNRLPLLQARIHERNHK